MGDKRGALARNELIIVPNFLGELTVSWNYPDKIPIVYEISHKTSRGRYIFIYVDVNKVFD